MVNGRVARVSVLGMESCIIAVQLHCTVLEEKLKGDALIGKRPDTKDQNGGEKGGAPPIEGVRQAEGETEEDKDGEEGQRHADKIDEVNCTDETPGHNFGGTSRMIE